MPSAVLATLPLLPPSWPFQAIWTSYSPLWPLASEERTRREGRQLNCEGAESGQRRMIEAATIKERAYKPLAKQRKGDCLRTSPTASKTPSQMWKCTHAFNTRMLERVKTTLLGKTLLRSGEEGPRLSLSCHKTHNLECPSTWLQRHPAQQTELCQFDKIDVDIRVL